MGRFALDVPSLAGGYLRALRRGPARRAALAAFVWMTLAGPALHLLDHRDDHVHEAGGAIRWTRTEVPAAGHHHGDGQWHTHRHANRGAAGLARFPTFAPAEDRVQPVHGVGAADHLGSAFLDAGSPGLASVAFESTGGDAIGPRPVFASRVLRSHRSRGPPSTPAS